MLMRPALVGAALLIGMAPIEAQSDNSAATAGDAQASEFWLVDGTGPAVEQPTLATLQGLCNKSGFMVWIRTGGLESEILENIKHGAVIHKVKGVWALLHEFRDKVKGVIPFDGDGISINVATSMCGPLNAIAVDESMLDSASAEGLHVIYDARGKKPLDVWNDNRDKFQANALADIAPDRPITLRDFAVEHNIFTFADLSGPALTQLVQQAGPSTTVYGWIQGNEGQRIEEISRGEGKVVPCGMMMNLSALDHIEAHPPDPQVRPDPAPAKTGERIVCFVLTDGDNLAFMGGRFATDEKFFSNPNRGTFNMSFELPPMMIDLDTWALRLLREKASPGPFYEDFVLGSSGAGYCFPNFLPDRGAFYKQTGILAEKMKLRIATVLNKEGDMDQVDELLKNPAISGVIYKDYNPYNKHQGAIHWFDHKPVRILSVHVVGKPPGWGSGQCEGRDRGHAGRSRFGREQLRPDLRTCLVLGQHRRSVVCRREDRYAASARYEGGECRRLLQVAAG